MLGLSGVPGFVMFVGILFFVPESPRWLIRKGKLVQATIILKKIRGKKDVDNEIAEIKASLTQEQGKLLDLLKPEIRPALLLGCTLQAFQQFCGINTAMYYSPTILKMAGFTKNTEAIWFSNVVACANMIFTIVAVDLIERIGRRKLLLASVTGAMIGLLLLGTSFLISKYIDDKISGFLSIGSLIVYIAFFAIGLGPIPWAVNSEIYPLNIRGVANSVATTVNWGSNLIVSFTFLSYISLVTTAGAFYTFAGIAVLAWIFVFFKLPETKGKTIEEIDAQLRGISRNNKEIVSESSV